MIYRAYCDDKLFFKSGSPELIVNSPKVELELNKAGSFGFTIYEDHPCFSYLKKLKPIITVWQDNDLIFRGRILNDDLGWINQKNVSCEGELAFLVDSIQRPYDFMSGEKHTTIPELFTFFIKNHNAQVDEAKMFKVGRVTVTDANNYIVRSDSTYLNTFESINKKLIEPCGGYLWVRHESDGIYLDYLADFTEINRQPIEFGKNLLNIGRKNKGENIVTALIPLGKKSEESEDRLTVESLPNSTDGDFCKKGDIVYSKSAVERYGWIVKSEKWDDVTMAANLKRKAEEWLAEHISFESTIELTSADLAGSTEGAQAFKIGRYIPVISEFHGIKENYLIKKLSLDLLHPGSNRITVGASFKSFTEQNKNALQNTAEIQQHIEKMQINYSNLERNVSVQIEDSVNKSSLAVTEWVRQDYYSKDETEKILPTSGSTEYPALLNGWSVANGAYDAPNYCKDSFGRVYISGTAFKENAAVGTKSIVFVFPEGFRPQFNEVFNVVSGSESCIAEINSDGELAVELPEGTNGFVFLSGMSFKANGG